MRAVFYDIENLLTSANVSAAIKEVRKNTPIAFQYAYADWSKIHTELREEVRRNGIEIKDVISSDGYGGYLRNSADISLTADVVESLFLKKEISEYILVSGDSGYIGLIEKLHLYKKKVSVISMNKSLSRSLKNYADKVTIFVDQPDTKREVIKLDYKDAYEIKKAERQFSNAEKTVWAILKKNEKASDIISVANTIFDSKQIIDEIKKGMPLNYLTSAAMIIFSQTKSKRDNFINLINSRIKNNYTLVGELVFEKKEKKEKRKRTPGGRRVITFLE